ncbi:MAG: hypothetical protein D6805_04655 [Planctomycetota bacterium]|nr:MAG: hypothetical protein D6805_04655 [Planctomycetota bacterium]
MFGKRVLKLLSGAVFLTTLLSPLFAQEDIDELDLPPEVLNYSNEIDPGPPPRLTDFAAGPYALTRQYMTGYLNVADSHTLKSHRFKAGVLTIYHMWSYKLSGVQVDNNFGDGIFSWGIGLLDWLELNFFVPVRWYYDPEIAGELVDLTTPINIFDTALSLKAAWKNPYFGAGIGVVQTFTFTDLKLLGTKTDGYGVGDYITKFTGILSFTPNDALSFDFNLSYYFGGDGKRTKFDFEGLVFAFGSSFDLSYGFALYGQIEYWNPFLPFSKDNSRITVAGGIKVQTTETGALFFSLGYSIKKPDLTPTNPALSGLNYKEDSYIYIAFNLVENW